MTLHIGNRDMRRLWLHVNGLGTAPTGPLDVVEIIQRLGFVQLDTIRNVTRAHHHILWSRNQNFREPMLDRILAERQHLFEHFTHDAAVLPTAFYPMWRRQFRRMRDRIDRGNYYRNMPDAAGREAIRQRIADEGPLSTRDFDSKVDGPKKMWSRPPHKQGLDYMWYGGELATSHRVDFRKYYDLTERVIPNHIRSQDPTDTESIDWLCRAALDRLGVATLPEIRAFWDAVSVEEAKEWHQSALSSESGQRQIVPVTWINHQRQTVEAFAYADLADDLGTLKPPPSRVRLINPFDPMIRDRGRLSALFGFDYRIEIFVPAPKRKWGYYVYPLLEGDRFIGRIELKADRKKGLLQVINFWPEPGVKWSDQRFARLDAELTRFARLGGVTHEPESWR